MITSNQRSGSPWMEPQDPDPASRPPGSPGSTTSSRLTIYVVLAALVLVIAFLAGLIPRLRQHQLAVETTRVLAVPTVNVVNPTPFKAATPLSLPAEIRPVAEAAIHARATGYVKHWLVDLGSTVTNGQVLAELDTPELNQELARAQARVNEVQAGLELARKSAARWEEMRKTQAVSQQEADERVAELALKTAQLDSARADVHRLEKLTGFAKVIAPFDGIVTVRKLDVGQLVSETDRTELFRLAQTTTLRVFVRVPQSLARSIAAGQIAEISFNELPNRKFPARVVRTAGALDAASRTLLVELELPNPEANILPGGYAQARFPDAHTEPILTVPANTLLYRNTGPTVALVTPSGEVELRPVKLGRDLGPQLEVLSGVTPSDRLILNPPDSIVEGAKVRVAEPKPAPRS